MLRDERLLGKMEFGKEPGEKLCRIFWALAMEKEK